MPLILGLFTNSLSNCICYTYRAQNEICRCRILCSYSGSYECRYLLGYSEVYYVSSQPTFRRHEDVGDMFPRNVGSHTGYTALYLRRWALFKLVDEYELLISTNLKKQSLDS
jgi:hypothetical protein